MSEMTGTQRSAYDLMLGILSGYGLASLAPVLQQLVKEETNSDVILFRLRETKEYQDRFPAMKELNQRGVPFTEQDYFNYEQRARQLESQYGLPSGFITSKDRVASLLLNNIDAEDLTRRVELNYASAMDAPQEVRDELERLYGIGPGGVAAFYLDPDNSQMYLEKVAASTKIASEGRRQGFALEREQAERFASLGYQQGQARQAFEQAGSIAGLMRGDYGVGEEDLVGAFFGDQEAARRVEQAQKSKTAQFASGGGAAASGQGVAGLGNSQV